MLQVEHEGHTYELRTVGAMVKPGRPLSRLWFNVDTGRVIWADDPLATTLHQLTELKAFHVWVETKTGTSRITYLAGNALLAKARAERLGHTVSKVRAKPTRTR